MRFEYIDAVNETAGHPDPASDTPTLPVGLDVEPPAGPAPPPGGLALLQVLAVSGVPTQLALAVILTMAGIPATENGEPSVRFFAVVGFLDTALAALLIQYFLKTSRESAATVFVGSKSPWREAALGLGLLPVVFVCVVGIVLALRTWLPFLDTVDENPLAAFLRTPLDAAVFLVVAIVAGGIREELQRAFILHRFDQRLGGMRVGLIVFSLFFGLLHLDQGVDVAIAITLLGLTWGIIYARRRSAVLAMVNHAGFNAVQVGQAVLARAMGVG